MLKTGCSAMICVYNLSPLTVNQAAESRNCRLIVYTILAGMNSARRVEIVEVGPATGCRTSPGRFAIAVRREFIERIVGAGIRRIEVASFVNPRSVPQMADADELVALAAATRRRAYIGLVLNRRGFERALAAGCDEIGMVVVATDTFNLRNQGATTAESIAAWLEIARAAKQPACARR